VKNVHYGDIHTKFSTHFDITRDTVPFVNVDKDIEKIDTDNYCLEGDMIFADASEDLKDVGKSIEIVNLNNERLLSGMHTILARQKEPKLIIGFAGHLFLSNAIRIQIQKEAQGAKVLGISGSRLSNVKICYPINKKEQKKIVECLSSLDVSIAEQNQKVGSLKAHKKGLMQQLFPNVNEIEA
ncbi:MAG: restriction endonuclease subunit S, partial [Flammeovirgaceae bacterium]